MNSPNHDTNQRARWSRMPADDASKLPFGQPIAEATCPKCEHRHSVVAVALTDDATRCPACRYVYWKIVDERGRVETFRLLQGVWR